MASMIFHRGCGSSTYVIATGAFRILSTVGITPKGLTISVINITQNEGSFDPQFYCVNCSQEVEKDELGCTCSHCGEILPISKAYILTKCGGVYCLAHATELSSNPRQILSMTKIIERASF